MTPESHERREMLNLLHALREEGVTCEQSQRLNELVKGNTAACKLYIDHMVLTAALRWSHLSLDPAQMGLTVGDAEVLHSGDGLSEDLPSVATTALSMGSVSNSWRPRNRLLVASVFVTALLFYGGFALISWNLHPDAAPQRFDHQDRVVAEDSKVTVPIAKFFGSTKSNLRITSATGAPRSGQSIDEGDTLEVTSGTVELAYESGAKVLLQAPTRFRIDSLSNSYLHRGTLVARIPTVAQGFTVQTASTTVIDLGTEFSVIALDSGETEVNVLQGRVSVHPTNHTASLRSKAFELKAGEGKRIQVDGNVTIATEAKSGIWDLLANSSSTQRIERQTFPAGLVSYWAFDEEEGLIYDRYGISHGEAKAESRSSGLIGRAALRSQGRSGQLAEIYSYEPEGTFAQAFSIEAMFISSWSGSPNDYDYICRKAQGSTVLFSFAFKNDDQDDVDGPVLAMEIETDRGLQLLPLPLDGHDGRPKLASLTDGKPHYVAATFEGASGEMAIYVDGVQRIRRSVGPSSLRSSDEGLPARSDTAGRHFDDPFTGVLDEIAVYRVALSPDEVARHWKKVSQGRSYFAQP